MTFSPFSQTVFKTKSKISGEIVVKEQFGQYTLHVQGMIQSGGIVKEIWEKPFKKISNFQFLISNVLVLGLGGGTVVQLIKERWPEAKVIGIEIDPEIVKIGKKFFGLGEIKNLKIIKANAFKWVGGCFDLIIVDLYLGDQFPLKAESERFLKNLKKLLSRKGVVIFNWLKAKSERQFEEKIKKIFPAIEKIETPTNLFFVLKLNYV